MGCTCLHFARFALQVLGYPDQALARSQEALALAEALSHPYTLAHELATTAFFYQFRREGWTAQARAESAIALVSEHGFSPSVGGARKLAGLGACGAGTGRSGDCAHSPRPRGPSDPWRLPSCGRITSGSWRRGWGKLDGRKRGSPCSERRSPARAAPASTGTTRSCIDCKGSLRPKQPGSGVPSRQAEPEAEACFFGLSRRRAAGGQALRVARGDELGPLRMRQGRQAEARSELAKIYGWFTEGFDTKDLQEARALLEILA